LVTSTGTGAPGDNPRIYVIILTWNEWPATAACLESLLKVKYPNYKVLIVDNASTDKTPDLIRERFPGVEVIVNKRNLGFAPGCNVGIRCALGRRADYVLLLNNDTTVPPELLDGLVGTAQALDDAGLIAPQIARLGDPSEIWFAGSRRNRFTLESVDLEPHERELDNVTQTALRVDYLFGTAMFIACPVIDEVGLLDEAFFFYYEDMDYCLRVQEAGYGIYSVPGLSIGHGIAQSTGSDLEMRFYHKAKGSVIFFRKHSTILRLFIVVPARFGSLVRTTIRLGWAGQWSVLRAYLRGLRDGLRSR
jgi:GT2 family glycosyltransferase